MYAVIMSGGKQYRVAEGDVVRVEKLEAESEAPVEFNQVLLVKTDKKTYIGEPLVEGASAEAEEEWVGSAVVEASVLLVAGTTCFAPSPPLARALSDRPTRAFRTTTR